MAMTIATDSESPGKGALRPTLIQANRVMKFVTGTVAFDASYPTGGEDIADIFDEFNDVTGTSQLLGIVFSPAGGRTFSVDYDNEKIVAYAGSSEVADTTDLSAVTGVRFLAWGYR